MFCIVHGTDELFGSAFDSQLKPSFLNQIYQPDNVTVHLLVVQTTFGISVTRKQEDHKSSRK
jgi:hypothetical protein